MTQVWVCALRSRLRRGLGCHPCHLCSTGPRLGQTSWSCDGRKNDQCKSWLPKTEEIYSYLWTFICCEKLTAYVLPLSLSVDRQVRACQGQKFEAAQVWVQWCMSSCEISCSVFQRLPRLTHFSSLCFVVCWLFSIYNKYIFLQHQTLHHILLDIFLSSQTFYLWRSILKWKTWKTDNYRIS